MDGSPEITESSGVSLDFSKLFSKKTFLIGATCQVNTAFAGMHEEPKSDSRLANQVLYGERVQVLLSAPGWVRVRALHDMYVGWVDENYLSTNCFTPTRRVFVARTPVRRKPDDKVTADALLGMNSLVRIVEECGCFAHADGLGWVPARHLLPVGEFERDHALIARRFVGLAYGWGERSAYGGDCSAVVQHAVRATGRKCPRDAKDQEKLRDIYRVRPEPDGNYRFMYGDVVFWKGHVGIVLDRGQFLHAAGDDTNMTVIEDLSKVIEARRRYGYGEVTSVLRL